MRSRCYKSLSEKAAFFGFRKTIWSIEELLTILRQCQKDRYVFRGQSNAFWKIRSTALRWWQDDRCKKCCTIKDYLFFIVKALQYSQKPEFPQLHPKCFAKSKTAWFGDHETMGYLQHYSYPTPLIDFTDDFYVALYMATRRPKSDAKYFSIYMLDPEFRIDNELNSFEELVEENADTCEQLKHMTNFYDGGLGPKTGWCQHSCVLIHKDGRLWCPHLAKERIASQGGLFVYMKSDSLSLEEQMNYYRDYDERDRRGLPVEPEIEALNTRPLMCLDIPCRFINAIHEIVEVEGYTLDSMGFSDMSRDIVAKACFEAFVKTIT